MNFKKILFFNCPLYNGMIRNTQVLSLASYSRNSKPSPYKIVKSTTNSNALTHENRANWELFGAKNNPFFLAQGSSGPAFLNHLSTHGGPFDLHELIDFKNKDKSKLHISFQKSVLIRNSLQEMFHAPEVINESGNMSLITLSQSSSLSSMDHEKAAIKYVFAAREICQKLRLHGYWCDFINPFSGRAFYSYHQKSLYKNDERFRGLCMKLESVKGFGSKDHCLLITEDKSTKFSGSVFTNLPSMEMFKELVLEEDLDE